MERLYELKKAVESGDNIAIKEFYKIKEELIENGVQIDIDIELPIIKSIYDDYEILTTIENIERTKAEKITKSLEEHGYKTIVYNNYGDDYEDDNEDMVDIEILIEKEIIK